MSYIHLSLAIVAELIATLSLKESNEFTRITPSIIVVLGYGTAFYFMALSMRTIPVGISYAIWSAVGILSITLVSAIRFDQKPDMPAVLGMALIVGGVVCLTSLSQMKVH